MPSATDTLRMLLLALEMEEDLRREARNRPPREVIVVADSVRQALSLAANELQKDILQLDYKILSRGGTKFFGLFRVPYRVHVFPAREDTRFSDIEDMHVSLSQAMAQAALSEDSNIVINADGKILVRIYRTGVYITVRPPVGDGKPVTMEQAQEKLRLAGVNAYDKTRLINELKARSGKPVKIAEWVPRPEADSQLHVEISSDHMRATVTITRPRPGGRHLQVADIIQALKANGVQFGFKEQVIEKALEEEIYSTPIVVAEGKPPQHGRDGYIDYKVRIHKKVEYKEDESGRVDFLERDLVENVVQGQVLAELVPAQRGVPGRDLFNKILPAKDGKPVTLRPGPGTMLSEDGKRLLAEKNGQVIYRGGILSVHDVFTVHGDVGMSTGNITFLGSIVVTGNIGDNMHVKAAGTIEVAGAIEKAFVEAEGDIIVRQGIIGRDVAQIESTAGSVYARFLQNATCMAEKDVVMAENIMHSRVYAGGNVVCNGKRAQVVGGEIICGGYVRVRSLGAMAATPTRVIAGANPRAMQQLKQIAQIEKQLLEKIAQTEVNLKTLQQQKAAAPEAFTPAKEEQLVKTNAFLDKLHERLREAQAEKANIEAFLKDTESQGAVHVEKTVYPGVTIEINGAVFTVQDEYNNVSFVEEAGRINIVSYIPPGEDDKYFQKVRRKGRYSETPRS
ncbi:MAG: FapA family protein [Turneriella sp.]|nr:FapA family protein [Turneriella sp.]